MQRSKVLCAADLIWHSCLVRKAINEIAKRIEEERPQEVIVPFKR
ncbi:hypothetical protein [Synechocystis sp. FACHB-383]|nr:hypothetical protein [Synechocystis sp. FACHB-383]